VPTVVVLGASPNPDRYAYLAMQSLRRHGYRAIPVNPAHAEILDERCYAAIGEVPVPIDTVTMYLGAARSTPLLAEIIEAKPRRIIFNPGAENETMATQARAAGIETVNACTLVMLSTGQF
jgi:predicted CoA-binding protein